MKQGDYLELELDRYSANPVSGRIVLVSGSHITTSVGIVDISSMGKPIEKEGVVFVPLE